MASKKNIIILLIIAVLLIIGFFLGYLVTKRTVTEGIKQETKEATIKEALPQISVANLHGVIKNIQGNNITLEVPEIMGTNIPLDSQLRTRTVVVSGSTKIYLRTALSQAELQKAFDKYKSDKAKGLNVTPPAPYETKEITLSQLAIGNDIQVIGETSDIKTSLIINATEIIKK